MREIKFRGIDTTYSKKNGYHEDIWRYGNLIINCEDKTTVITKGSKLGYGNVNAEVIPDTVGQYAGLKDKNGVEVYEGDIFNHFATFGYVIFEDGMFTLSTSANRQFGKYRQPLCYLGIGKGEVIGNIYENPELLEVE